MPSFCSSKWPTRQDGKGWCEADQPELESMLEQGGDGAVDVHGGPTVPVSQGVGAAARPLVLQDTRIVTPRAARSNYEVALGAVALAGGAAKIAAKGAQNVWGRCPIWAKLLVGCNLVLLLFVGLVFLLLSLYMPIARLQVQLRCVRPEAFVSAFPPPPEELPQAWRGVMWMDQTGVYGRSDVEGQNASSASLAFSFGISTYDPNTRTVKIGGRGNRWPWQGRHAGSSWLTANRFMGYEDIYWARFYGYSYVFTFNEDFTAAQIVPTFAPLGGWIGSWGIPVGMMNYTIRLQNLAGKQCPPPAKHADKLQVTECAKFIRTTRLWDWFPEWADMIGEYHYPVFEIIDPTGAPVEPFYSHYSKYAARSADPNPDAAYLYLAANLTELNCTAPGTALADVS